MQAKIFQKYPSNELSSTYLFFSADLQHKLNLSKRCYRNFQSWKTVSRKWFVTSGLKSMGTLVTISNCSWTFSLQSGCNRTGETISWCAVCLDVIASTMNLNVSSSKLLLKGETEGTASISDIFDTTYPTISTRKIGVACENKQISLWSFRLYYGCKLLERKLLVEVFLLDFQINSNFVMKSSWWIRKTSKSF